MKTILSYMEKDGEEYVYVDFESIFLRVNLNLFEEYNNIRLSEQPTSTPSSLIDVINIDGTKYYLYTSKSNILYLTNNVNKYCKVRQNLKCKVTDDYVCFYGLFSDITHKIEGFDKILLNGEVVGQVKRRSSEKKLKDYAIIKIAMKDILESERIHNNLRIGKSQDLSVPVLMKTHHEGMNYWVKKKVGDNLIIVRSIINGFKIRITNIKFEEEYKKVNMIKDSFAFALSKLIGTRNINLMFEKETNRACESGFYAFEKIMEKQKHEKLKSKTYFVIDKNSEEYPRLKSLYGKNIIEKYSFRHYLYIYLCRYFISSELSNHVINPRLYIRRLNECIRTKPLIFLQHGIMFSKPVDNPAAANFRKDNETVNFYKNVISSDLEATQFYKCGFEDEDLIKCGLPKFDLAKLDDDADKIMVMLTYRYWEESFVMDEEAIKETTYFKAYMRVLEAFEKNDLLDRLIISCHPKFTDFLNNLNPKYAKCVENDIAKGLAESKIFITDYSSASYDAHYRGAYIIYYWEEKDYLIKCYRAIPPINENNCDGVPVFSPEELIEEVKYAIANNYVMDEKFEKRYSKINEFHDGKNGDRLLDELSNLDVI